MRLHGILLGLSVVFTTAAQAAPLPIWANSAGFGAPILSEFDTTTGALIQSITAPHGINGRGIVNVGDVLYYTDATDNHVYAYNFVTLSPTPTLEPPSRWRRLQPFPRLPTMARTSGLAITPAPTTPTCTRQLEHCSTRSR